MAKLDISKAWEEFYEKYPGIKEALVNTRLKDHFEGTLNYDRLYKYWEEAGLDYTYQEAFNTFLASKQKFEFEEYNTDLEASDNTRVARNNMLLHLIQCRLQDSETLKARYTPGGFTYASKTARLMREIQFNDGITINTSLNEIREMAETTEDPKPNNDPTDVQTMLIYNEQNQIAGKLIGTAANHRANHAISTFMRNFYLKTPIKFGNHYNTKGLGNLNHNRPNSEFDVTDPYQVSLMVAEVLAASVDAVKDPVLNYMNLNTLTISSAMLLLRIGYSMDEVGLLLNQPIIKDICRESLNNNVSLDIAVSNIERRLQETYKFDDSDISEDPKNVSTDNLLRYIISDKHSAYSASKNSAKEQLAVLNLFKQINTSATELQRFVTNTKFTAANSVGSTFGSLYEQQMKVNDYVQSLNSENSNLVVDASLSMGTELTSPIDDSLDIKSADYMEKLINSPLAYEQAMYDANKRILTLLSKYFPYETKIYTETRNSLKSLTQYPIDADMIDNLHKDILVYLLVNNSNIFDEKYIQRMRNGDFVSNVLERYSKDEHLRNTDFFKYVVFDTNPSGKPILYIQDVAGLEGSQKEAITNSWESLLYDEEYSQLAIDLFMYNIFNTGYDFKAKSFGHLCPTRVKDSCIIYRNGGKIITYSGFMQNILDQKDYIKFDTNTMLQKYCMQHYDNWKLQCKLYGDAVSTIRKCIGVEEGTNKDNPDTFRLSYNDVLNLNVSDKVKSSIIVNHSEDRDGNTTTNFKPIILIPRRGNTVDYNSTDVFSNYDVYIASNLDSFNTTYGNSSPIVYKKFTVDEYKDYSELQDISVKENTVSPTNDEGSVVAQEVNNGTQNSEDTYIVNNANIFTNDNYKLLSPDVEAELKSELYNVVTQGIKHEGTNLDNGMEQEIREIIEGIFTGNTTYEVKDTINSILQDVKNLGLKVIDENGNEIKAC